MSWNDFRCGSKKKKSFYVLSVLLVIATLTLSIYGIASALGTVSNLSVNPNPINIGSNCSLSYTLSQTGKVYIKIFNADNGQLVKTLLNGNSRAAGTNYQTWNTTDSSGILVPAGMYRFTVEEKDTVGNSLGTGEITVQAGTPLTIGSASVSPAVINPNNSENTTISYTLSTAANVTVVVLDKNQSTVQTIISGAAQNAGSNSAVWDGKVTGGAAAPDGSYTCKITATSGAATVTATTGVVKVEKEAPSITGFTATPNPLKLTSQNLSISYTLSEEASVQLRIMDGSGGLVKTVLDNVTKNAGSNTTNWDGKDSAGSYVASGTYTVSISAVDSFGKSSGEQSTVIKAGYVPVITASVAPAIFNPEATTGNTAVINYNLSVPANVTVEIISSGLVVKTITTAQPQVAGSHAAVWDGTNDSGSIAADKAYTYRITAVTTEGLTTILNSSDSTTVDTGPAEITGVNANPNPYRLGNSGYATLSYTLSENATVSIDVYKGTTLVKNLATGLAKNAGTATIKWDGKDGSGNESEGTYTFVIKAVDNEGWSSEASASITAGFKPAMTSGPILTPGTVFNPPVDGNQVFSFTLDHDAKVTLTISQSGSVIRTISNPLMTAGGQTLTWDGTNSSGSQVADGPYDYKIEVVSPTVSAFFNDASGIITVEAANPAITGLSIAVPVAKIGTGTKILYTLSEPATVTVKILDSVGTVIRQFPAETKTRSGLYSIDWDTRKDDGNLISGGTYTLRADAVDSAFKTGFAQTTFQAENVPHISGVSANPSTIDLSTARTLSTISYSVDINSNVTVKVLGPSGNNLKTLVAYKQTLGADSVVLDVYNGGNIYTGPLTYTIDATSVVGSFKAVRATGTIEITGTLPPGGPINPPPPGPASGCTACHRTYPAAHPMTNCTGCHGGSRPVADCNFCHGTGQHSSDLLGRYTAHVPQPGVNFNGPFACEECHSPQYADKIPGHGDLDVIHRSTTTNCVPCHLRELNLEHPLHNDDVTGAALDCVTCHTSDNPLVVQAITNGVTACTACHTADHEQYHSPTGIEANCVSCHIDSLSQEHLTNSVTQTTYNPDTGKTAWTCDTCHAPTARQEVVDAVYNNNRNCAACHTSANHQTVHETNNLDTNCTTCHSNNLVFEHMQNDVTHTKTIDTVTQVVYQSCNSCHQSTNPTVIGAVYTDNMQCAACHQSGHNVNFVEKVPANLPLYPGYSWAPPQQASLWAGESWMPDEFILGGRLLISNRMNVSGVDAWVYYDAQMPANGWTQTSADPDTNAKAWSVSYSNGDIHRAVVWFYGTAGHDGAGDVLPSGYRLELLYK